MARRGTRPSGSEHAFTLVELIVGMILLAIALGMVGTAIVQAVSGSSSASSGAASDTAIARVVARFQDDLAKVETQDRVDRLVREQVLLDNALRRDANAPSDDPSDPRPNVNLEDITEARPDRLTVHADVDRATAGVECVQWRVTPARDAIERIVRRSGCGAEIERERMIEMNSAAADAITQPFSYDLVCNRTLCAGMPPAPAGSECAPLPRTLVTGRRDLRRVVAVRASFVTHSGRDATQARSATAMSIRSRAEHGWRTALGC